MKILRNYFFQALVFVVTVILMQSCSCNEGTAADRVRKVASDKTDIIVAGDVRKFMEQAEVEVKDGRLVLPQYFVDFMSSVSDDRYIADDIDEIESVRTGIDFSSCVVAASVSRAGGDFVFSFGIDDVDEFYAFLQQTGNRMEMSKIGGYTIIGDRYGSMVIDGKDAYMVFRNGDLMKNEKAVTSLEKWFQEAKETPVEDWKVNYLTENTVLSAWMSNEALRKTDPKDWQELKELVENVPGVKIPNLSLGISFDIEGATATGNLTVFDGDQVMKSPFGGEFDTNLLKYTTNEDVVIYGGALNEQAIGNIRMLINNELNSELKSYQDELRNGYTSPEWCQRQIASITTAKNLFNTICESTGGSVMMAFGGDFSDVTKLMNNPQNAMHFVMAANCKPGQAAKVLAEIVKVMNEIAPGSMTLVGNKATMKIDDFTVYVEVEGNNLVASNAKITTNGKISGDVFVNTWLAGQVRVDKNNPVMKLVSMPFGVEISGKAVDMSLNFTMSFPGSDKKFIPTIFGIMRDLVPLALNFYGRGYGYDYDDYGGYDYADADFYDLDDEFILDDSYLNDPDSYYDYDEWM